MTDRKYSVHELDALRRAVENKYLWGSHLSTGYSGMSRSYNYQDKTKYVEETVRTHMIAGHTAEDLIASEQLPSAISDKCPENSAK